MIKNHSELEKYHYQALKNPQYVAEGVMDVIREELAMNQPYTFPEEKPQPVYAVPIDVQQLKAEVVGWRKKHAELQLALDRLNKQTKKSKYD